MNAIDLVTKKSVVVVIPNMMWFHVSVLHSFPSHQQHNYDLPYCISWSSSGLLRHSMQSLRPAVTVLLLGPQVLYGQFKLGFIDHFRYSHHQSRIHYSFQLGVSSFTHVFNDKHIGQLRSKHSLSTYLLSLTTQHEVQLTEKKREKCRLWLLELKGKW